MQPFKSDCLHWYLRALCIIFSLRVFCNIYKWKNDLIMAKAVRIYSFPRLNFVICTHHSSDISKFYTENTMQVKLLTSETNRIRFDLLDLFVLHFVIEDVDFQQVLPQRFTTNQRCVERVTAVQIRRHDDVSQTVTGPVRCWWAKPVFGVVTQFRAVARQHATTDELVCVQQTGRL